MVIGLEFLFYINFQDFNVAAGDNDVFSSNISFWWKNTGST